MEKIIKKKIELSLNLSDFNLIIAALVSYAIILSEQDCLFGADRTKILIRELLSVKKMSL